MRKWNIVFLIILSGMFLCGCPEVSVSEKGNLEIFFQLHSGSKTIVPEISSVIDHYEIRYIDGPDSFEAHSTSDESFKLVLIEGVWSLSVEAVDSEGNIVAGADLESISVSGGASTVATAFLNGFQDAEGSIDITVTWPDSITVESLIKFDDSEISSDSPDVTHIPGGLNFAIDSVPSGNNHKFEAYFTPEGSSEATPVVDIIYVYDFLTTSHDYELVNSDFNTPPESPGNLNTEITNEGIIISWVDNSNNEACFNIYRGTSNVHSSSSIIGTVEGFETYTDDSVVDGVSYYYFITAENSIGESEPLSSDVVQYSLDGIILNIELNEPTYTEILFSQDDHFSVVLGNNIAISINDGFDIYEWYMDGSLCSDQIDASFLYDSSELIVGNHKISVIAGLNSGNLVSDEIKFTVTE